MPRKHVGSWFDITEQVQLALLRLQTQAQQNLQKEFNPDGYTLGINDGPAAGQSVPHLHMHLIPRYNSDAKLLLMRKSYFSAQLTCGMITALRVFCESRLTKFDLRTALDTGVVSFITVLKLN